MGIERLTRSVSRFFQERSLQEAIRNGNWERVGVLSDSLGRSDDQRNRDLISAYRVLKSNAQQRGDRARVEEVERIIGQTAKKLNSPEVLEQSL